MEATLGTLNRYADTNNRNLLDFGRAIGSWLAGIFGCSHKNLSRPFSRHGEGYRVCIDCGARRSFDEQTWNSRGPFYYKVASTSELLEVECSAVRSL